MRRRGRRRTVLGCSIAEQCHEQRGTASATAGEYHKRKQPLPLHQHGGKHDELRSQRCDIGEEPQPAHTFIRSLLPVHGLALSAGLPRRDMPMSPVAMMRPC